MKALKFKSKEKLIRVIYSDDPGKVDNVTKNPGKVFCVIGPFDNHSSQIDLQNALELLVKGFNLEEC